MTFCPDHCDILITHCNVATLSDGNLGLISNACVAIQGEQIVWVGKQNTCSEALRRNAKVTHNAANAWVLPGFIDCDTQLIYASPGFERQATRTDVIQSTRQATIEQLTLESEERLRQLLSDGVTTLNISSGFGLDHVTEKNLLKVARYLGEDQFANILTTYQGASGIPKEYQASADDYVAWICDEILPALSREDLIDSVGVVCGENALSASQCAPVFHKARSLEYGIRITGDTLSHNNALALAAEYHARSTSDCTYATSSDIALASEANVVGILLPSKHYYTQEKQVPLIAAMRENNMALAIASGIHPCTAPTTSLRLSMNMGHILFGLTPEEIIRGVTVNAALALGMGQSHGQVQAGFVADLNLWQIDHPYELVTTFGTRPKVTTFYRGVIREDIK